MSFYTFNQESPSIASSSPSSSVERTEAYHDHDHESNERSALLFDTKTGHTRQTNDRNQQSRTKVRGRLVIVILSCAGFLNIFTAQSTIILLPAISRAYDISTQQQSLVASVYNVSSGCLILLWARLADVHGRRLIFLFGSTAYTLTSALLPLAPTASILFTFRALQGVSVAAVIPSSIGILTSTFPEGERRNAALVVFNAAASLGAVLGNVMGGVIGGFLSWRWVFWLAAILGGMISLGAFVVIDPRLSDTDQKSDDVCPKSSRTYVDWTGGVLITGSLGILTTALTITNGRVLLWMVAQVALSVVLAVFFVIRQRRLEKCADTPPLMRMSIFKQKGFTAALVTYACFLASFNSFLIYVSFFFQQYQRLPVLEATLRFVPSGVSCFLFAPLLPPVLLRYSHYRLLLLAIFALVIPPLLLALPIPPLAPYFWYIFPALILTCSVELASPIISLFVVRNLARSDQSLGGGLLQTANNVGKALGLAIAGGARAVVDGYDNSSSDQELLQGLRAAQWVNVGLAVLTMAVAARGLQGFQNETEELKESDAE